MACDKFPCQSLYWGSKNQVQKNSKKIKTNTSSCTKGFGGHREQSVKQRPECKLSGECNQRRGNGGGGNWCRKRKELRTVSGGGHASSLRLVLSKETTESLSERCLSNNQKGEVGGQQPSTATQTPGQRFSPWTSAVTHEWALSTFVAPPTALLRDLKAESEAIQSGSEVCHGQLHLWESWHPEELDTAGIRDRWGPNLGNESQVVTYTHIGEKGQFFFHHFAILSPSF